MIDMEVEQSWKRYIQQIGLSEEQMLQFLKLQKQTKEDVTAPLRDIAAKSLRLQLIMEKIKEAEAFPIEEEEVDNAMDEQLKEITDQAQLDYYRTMIEDDLRFQKITPFLRENNTFVEGEEVAYETFMSETYGE